MSSVTIYLKDGQAPDIKSMLADLKSSNSSGNPYRGRSESEIARLLIELVIDKEHKAHCMSEERVISSGENNDS